MAQIFIDSDDLRRLSGELGEVAEADIASANRALGSLRPDFPPQVNAAAAAMLGRARVGTNLQQVRLYREKVDLEVRAARADLANGPDGLTRLVGYAVGVVAGNATGPIRFFEPLTKGFGLDRVLKPGYMSVDRAARVWNRGGWRVWSKEGRAVWARSQNAQTAALLRWSGWSKNSTWKAIKRWDQAMNLPVAKVAGRTISAARAAKVGGWVFAAIDAPAKFGAAKRGGATTGEAVLSTSAETVGSVAGGAIGATAGAALGTFLGPAGTAAGAVVGSMVGSWAGGKIGKWVGGELNQRGAGKALDALGGKAADVVRGFGRFKPSWGF